ncbi:hypothetical protein GCM10010349_68740 [Streptomyces flavofungini]|uniref:Uncharacterized protein n=1 Tax=Streptomyces flavofungini TaxID=68200 RepID=A0ABS0XC75_9ACTN|nr:hypothetical protein [Streptomyces flavofungini]MBJ3810544.1 hypothetical protein [Streptomyces flavofungini]GHC84044.1 hypothetical protein GCM10010349_68740 [Streptomyces flavofungini]
MRQLTYLVGTTIATEFADALPAPDRTALGLADTLNTTLRPGPDGTEHGRPGLGHVSHQPVRAAATNRPVPLARHQRGPGRRGNR